LRFFEKNKDLFREFYQAYMNDRSFCVLKEMAALEKSASSLKIALAEYSKRERRMGQVGK